MTSNVILIRIGALQPMNNDLGTESPSHTLAKSSLRATTKMRRRMGAGVAGVDQFPPGTRLSSRVIGELGR